MSCKVKQAGHEGIGCGKCHKYIEVSNGERGIITEGGNDIMTHGNGEKKNIAGKVQQAKPRNYRAYMRGKAAELAAWISDEKAAWNDKKKVFIWLSDFLLYANLTIGQFKKYQAKNAGYKKEAGKLMLLQELSLCKAGESKTSIPFVIFALKNCCGWRDGREVQGPKSAGKAYTDDTPEG